MLLKSLCILTVSQGGSIWASSSKTVTQTYQELIAQGERELAASMKLAFEKKAEQEERMENEVNSKRNDMEVADDGTDADIEGTGLQADPIGGYTCRTGVDDLRTII